MSCRLDNQQRIDRMIRDALDPARGPRPITARALAELHKCATVAELHKLAKGCEV